MTQMSTNTHHTHSQGQAIGRAGDLSVTRLYKTSKTLHPTHTYLVAAAAECCSRGRKHRLCGYSMKHKNQTHVSISGGTAVTHSTTQT